MTRLQIVLGPIPESVMTVAFEQHPPDMVLVHGAELTALDVCRGLDVTEEGSEFVCDGCEALDVMKEGRELVCDGCESVLVGSSSESSGLSGLSGLSGFSGPSGLSGSFGFAGGPFGDGVYGGGGSSRSKLPSDFGVYGGAPIILMPSGFKPPGGHRNSSRNPNILHRL